MTSGHASRLIRLALAASLAVVTTMPPAMGHAHAGGDRPHQHDHDGHPHHRAHPAAQPTAVSAGWGTSGDGRFAHVHFVWLGLELTFAWPVGAASTGDGQGEHIVVRLLDSAAQGSAQVDVQSPFVAGPWVCPAEALDPQSARRAELLRTDTSRAPANVLLCDAARHERSGVQLS